MSESTKEVRRREESFEGFREHEGQGSGLTARLRLPDCRRIAAHEGHGSAFCHTIATILAGFHAMKSGFRGLKFHEIS